MITTILRGGLGNQMFQYATGFALARRNSSRLIIDTTFLNDRSPRIQFTYREYGLDIFNISPEFTILSKISDKLPIPWIWLGFDIATAEFQTHFGKRKLIKGKSENYDEAVAKFRGEATLWGFWQNERYFADAKKEILSAFQFQIPLDASALSFKKEIESSNSVSIHVRRGDYLMSRNTKLHEATAGNYYDRAIAYMTKKIERPIFFVFSDDIEWCRKNIKAASPMVYLERNTSGPKSSFHLQLMSLCKHNIIARSSFSWWGAWLNKNPDKIVVAPRTAAEMAGSVCF